MSAPTSLIVERRGAVRLLTLNRPDNANVLDIPLAKALLDQARICATDRSIRAVVLTGAGKHFCFGGDLRGMMSSGAAVEPFLLELTAPLHEAVALFVRMDAPLITAVNGTAAGAGIGLVAMADLTFCGESSKFSLAYSGVALTPDCGCSVFLPRAIGAKRALELLLLNRALSAREALEWGLVNQVVPDAELQGAALALAERLAAGPRGAFGETKRLVAASLGDFEAQLARESETIARQAATPEGNEGIRAFLDKRKASYV